MSAAARSAATGVKTCACTGVRWCARCLDPAIRAAHGLRTPLTLPSWLERALAIAPGGGAKAHEGTDDRRLHVFDSSTQCAPTHPSFTGVRVYPEALSVAETQALLRTLESSPFFPSQSGKHKQHHGPRVNFLRRRMNADRFEGLPAWAGPLESRLRDCVAADRAGDPHDLARCRAALGEFETTDAFVLRYAAAERPNLVFHVDDLFAYGEAILDVSLDADSVLTFLGPRPSAASPPVDANAEERDDRSVVRVPLPARSIAVVYGPVRFDWEHAILADDVEGVRTSITLRTLAPALRETPAGRAVLARARAGQRS